MGIEPTVDLSGPPLDLKSRRATRPLTTPMCLKSPLEQASRLIVSRDLLKNKAEIFKAYPGLHEKCLVL